MIKLERQSMLLYYTKPFFIIILLCSIFSIVWLRSSIISMEYTISELENGKLERLKETRMLMAEKASLESSQKVEKRAARELGLVLADRTKVVYVKGGIAGPSRASAERHREPVVEKDIPEKAKVIWNEVVRQARVRVNVDDGGYR